MPARRIRENGRLFSQRIPLDIVARVLAIMGMVSVGFLLFILFTSNPFSRTLPNFPIEGRDLNPLLQDPGLIFHPPLLYMGYVGFSVAFAFAIASLLSGRLDSARWGQPPGKKLYLMRKQQNHKHQNRTIPLHYPVMLR